VKIAIFGAGAVGSWVGGSLEAYGQEVTLIGRPSHVDVVNAEGLRIDDNVTGETQVVSFSRPAVAEMPAGEEFDLILVTTKAYALDQAATDLAAYLPDTPTCLLQNGIGNEDAIWTRAPSAVLARALTSHGVIFEGAGHVTHTGDGLTFIGPVTAPAGGDAGAFARVEEAAQSLATTLTGAGIPTDYVTDIDRRAWEKVCVNIGINPFGAIAGVPNGALLEVPGMPVVMEGAVREAMAVAAAKGIDWGDLDPVESMFTVAGRTVHNRNSMLQDLEHGKVTEIMFMNGRIAAWGTELGIPTPINATVTALVHVLEQKSV
jgi:2-dehydropantoate 2-reductase